MKTKIYTYPIYLLLAGCLFVSCKSVNKLYQKGDYEQAVYTAVKKIQKNKLSAETKALITEAYAKAVQQHETDITVYANSNDALKWEAIAGKYTQLQRLGAAIQSSPEALQYVTPKNYQPELQEAINNIVAVRKQRGVELIANGTKEAARRAYDEFSAARQWDDRNTEIVQLQQQAYEAAVTNIVIAPMQSRFYSYSTESRDIENSILCNLQHNSSRFTRYYTSYSAQAGRIRTDQVLNLYYDGIDNSREHINSSEKNVQKDNVLLREIKIRPDSIVKEYGSVFAKLTTYKITQNFIGKINLVLEDASNNRVLRNSTIEADYCYRNEYARFTGDERALTSEQLLLVQRNRNQLDRNSMVRSIAEELSRKVSSEMQYIVF